MTTTSKIWAAVTALALVTSLSVVVAPQALACGRFDLICKGKEVAKKAKEAIERKAREAGEAIAKKAREAKEFAERTAKAAKEALERQAKAAAEAIAKKAAEAKAAMEAAAKKAKDFAGNIADVVEHVWEHFKLKILEPVGKFFKEKFEAAKKAMSNLIDKAKEALGNVLHAEVIVPALVFAVEHLLPGGAAMIAKLKVYVERILGRAEAIAQRQEDMAAVVAAIQANDAAGYKTAMDKFEAGLIEWTTIKLEDVVKVLVESLRGKLTEFVKARVLDLLDKGFSLVERPIELGKNAALSAIASIPVAGGMLRGAADVIITQGLKLLRSMGFQFVATKAAELAGKAVDALTPYLLKGAAALDEKLKPIVEKLKPFLQEAMKLVGGVRDEWFKLRDKLREAGKDLKASLPSPSPTFATLAAGR